MAGKLVPRGVSSLGPAGVFALRFPRFLLLEDGGNSARGFPLSRGSGIGGIFGGFVFGPVFDLEFVCVDGGGKRREIGRLVAYLVEVAVS